MNGQPERLAELDSLRGLVALAVVLHHGWLLLPRTPGDGLEPLDWLLSETPLRIVGAGRPAVVFFFVLSGYVLARALVRRPVGWTTYAAQRAIRLGLPVAAAVLASCLLRWLVWAGPLPEEMTDFARVTWSQDISFGAVLRQATLLNTYADNSFNPVLWSLVHEWRIALLMPAVLLFRTRPWALPAIGAVALIVSLGLGVPMDGGGLGANLLETLFSSLYFVLPFAVGAGLALTGPPPRPFGLTERWMAGIGVLLAMAASRYDLVAVAGSAMLILLVQQGGPSLGWLRHPAPLWLGRISFSLYLIHLPVMTALVHLLHEDVSVSMIVALSLPASLAAAVLLHATMEAPAQRLARRVAPPVTLRRADAARAEGARSGR